MSYVFQSGDRVRLAVEFVGNIWEKEPSLFAGQGDGPNGKGDPIAFPAGSTGTITPGTDTSPQARYAVIMDGPSAIMDSSSATLVVSAGNLEGIPGRTRVVSTGEDTFRIEQIFDYHDVVRFRRRITLRDGSTYEAGTLGFIDPFDFSMSQAQCMERSWETGIYQVRLPRDDVRFNLPASILQLDSDFRPSGRPPSDQERRAVDGGTSAVDASSARDLWAFVVAVGEEDEQTADVILARGEHVKTLVQAATSHILAQMREEGKDPVGYGRSMIRAITEKEATDAGFSGIDTSSMRDLWAFVTATAEDLTRAT